MSNKKSKYPVLQVDLRSFLLFYVLYCLVCVVGSCMSFWQKGKSWWFRGLCCILFWYCYFSTWHYIVLCRLISDLVVVIVSAAIGGIISSCLGQPVCALLLVSWSCHFCWLLILTFVVAFIIMNFTFRTVEMMVPY